MNRESKRWAFMASLVSFLVGLVLLAYVPDVETNHPNWASIMKLSGSFLTISVIVSILYSTFIKPSDDAARKKELKILFDAKIEEITIGKGKYGFSGFVDKMDFSSLFRELKRNQTLWWLDTYPVGAEMWTDELEDALASGVHIKMMVLYPKSPNVAHRASELGSNFTSESFEEQINRFLTLLRNIGKKGLSGKLEVRTYNELIGLPMYIVTENDQPIVGYSGFFLCKPTAVESPHLKWGVGERSILNLMTTYIFEKWERNQSNSEI